MFEKFSKVYSDVERAVRTEDGQLDQIFGEGVKSKSHIVEG